MKDCKLGRGLLVARPRMGYNPESRRGVSSWGLLDLSGDRDSDSEAVVVSGTDDFIGGNISRGYRSTILRRTIDVPISNRCRKLKCTHSMIVSAHKN